MGFTNDQLLLAIVKSIPYPEHMTEICTTNQDSIGFEWRGKHYLVTSNCMVSVLDGQFFSSGKPECLFLEQLLKYHLSAILLEGTK